MKKILYVIMLLLFLLNIGGCSMKHIDNEQSVKNFEAYKADIEKIAVQHGYALAEISPDIIDQYDSNHELSGIEIEDDDLSYYTKEYVIKIGENSSIEIWFQNLDFREKVSIDYLTKISCMEDMNKHLNIQLFSEIVNAVSSKKITEDYCSNFLNAPESKYPPEKYCIEKADNLLIFKYVFLNFWEDWSIGYELTDHYEEKLSFWGLSKQH